LSAGDSHDEYADDGDARTRYYEINNLGADGGDSLLMLGVLAALAAPMIGAALVLAAIT
jgi:hypothetical protein